MAGKKGMHKKWLNNPHTRERIIEAIQKSRIAQSLISYAETGEGMDPQRAQVCLGLLRKVVPDLSSTEIEDRREGWSDFLKRIEQSRGVSELPGHAERITETPADVAPMPNAALLPADTPGDRESE